MFTSFHLPDSGLYLLKGFGFYFDLFWMAWHRKPAIGWGKSQILVWNRVRVSGSVPYTPSHFFWKCPPEFLVVFLGHKRQVVVPGVLWPWKLGLRIVAWLKPRMFCEESSGKIKFRAFPKRVDPHWILSLESVDYFGASEHYWVVEKNSIRLNLNGEGGGGLLPYMGYIGMCRCVGYGFQVVYFRIGYVNQSVWV